MDAVRELLDWILAIAAAVAVALPLRAFVFELVRVKGRSMDDTLTHREIMFVTKYEYTTVWLSLPWQNRAAHEKARRIRSGGSPRRFDVVVCRYPGRGRTNFVKRVVALPGETVELRDGDLYICGERYDEPWISSRYRSGGRNTFGPCTVPEDSYFVLGDHRNNSNDSRSVGALTRDMIIGHARVVLFPFRKIREIR